MPRPPRFFQETALLRVIKKFSLMFICDAPLSEIRKNLSMAYNIFFYVLNRLITLVHQNLYVKNICLRKFYKAKCEFLTGS